jgi:transcription-repair coupling factor (superfamily II helicase)
MSTSNIPQSCQKVLAHIVSHMLTFEHEIGSDLYTKPKPTPLRLSHMQLALLVSHWHAEDISKAVIINAKPAAVKSFHQLVHAWNDWFSTPHRWHFIAAELSEQERDGTVSTDVSRAYHHLLFSEASDNHFIIPASVIDKRLPDKNAYSAACLTVAVHEALKPHDIIEHCVQHGYTRSRTTLEPNSVRLRGETVDIAHSILLGHYTITFFGNTIESIVHHTGRRSTNGKTLNIPPVAFPQKTMSWNDFLASRVVFRPEHLTSCNGQHTIITDAGKPNHAFPFKETLSSEIHNTMQLLLYRNRDRVEAYVRDQHDGQALMCQSPLASFPVSLHTSDFSLKTEASIFPHDTDRASSPVPYERA